MNFIFRAYRLLNLSVLLMLCVLASPNITFALSKEGGAASKNSLDGAVDAFYTAREGKPFWIDGSRLNDAGRDLVIILEQSWAQGLNPENYHLDEITRLVGSEGRGRIAGTQQHAFYLELILTNAYIHYVQDMSGMRVSALDLGLSPSDWRQPLSVEEALFSLSRETDTGAFLNALEPQGQTYRKMKEELIRLAREEENTAESFEPIRMKVVLHPGRGNAAVPEIRARLGLPSTEQIHSYTYDDGLVSAVMAFQKENGLKPDGIIGEKTLNTLNRNRVDKMHQIIVNMERLRWVEQEKPERFVVVNLPSATLWALDHGVVKFEMPVVIGRPERATPSFRTNIIGVRFNPSWTVPPTIKKEDILPKLREDSSYLTNKGMELYDGYGPTSQTLDPTSIDWSSITQNDLHGLRFVQIPGEHNPLGWVRILMPNVHDIYLHDTNHPELFQGQDRAQSSGCVRMRYPEKMADFVLSGQESWSDQKMLSLLKAGKTFDWRVDQKIPVFLLYYTAWIGADGEIVYGDDVYGRDKKLLSALEKIDGFSFPYYNKDIAVNMAD